MQRETSWPDYPSRRAGVNPFSGIVVAAQLRGRQRPDRCGTLFAIAHPMNETIQRIHAVLRTAENVLVGAAEPAQALAARA